MTTYRQFPLTAVIAMLVCANNAQAAGAQTATAARFPVAKVRFEQNATDGDVEVVFEVTGRSDGLAQLRITGPDGRNMVDFKASDKSTMGIRQFVLESPEPNDVASLKAAYPEGAYKFEGATHSGAQLAGEATLKHQLPATTSFVSPQADAEDVPLADVTITWSPVPSVAGYIVEIENDELNVNLTVKLPPTETKFSLPDGFLQPGAEYQLGIGTVATDGNVSYVETSFTTVDP